VYGQRWDRLAKILLTGGGLTDSRNLAKLVQKTANKTNNRPRNR